MKKIDPLVLKRLREVKGWTQDVLAEKTKFDGLPKIDKQTISRLERDDRSKTRSRTIEQLARALSVEAAVLTGEKPVPERQREASSLDVKSQLNVRVGTGPRNSLSLVARRYRVDPSQIVELAPFLFVWAAEASLRQRRDKIAEVKRACDAARDAESGVRHLPISNYTYTEEKLAAESEFRRTGRLVRLVHTKRESLSRSVLFLRLGNRKSLRPVPSQPRGPVGKCGRIRGVVGGVDTKVPRLPRRGRRTCRRRPRQGRRDPQWACGSKRDAKGNPKG